MASSLSDDDEYAPLSSFLCPIMQELMSDPVCTIDGHSYEKAAITTWFERRITSPLTGTVLGSRTLVPNHALRHSISQWLQHCSERHRAARRRRARAAGSADACAGRAGGAGGSGAGQDECKDGGGGGGGGGGGDGRGLSSSGIEAAVDAREEELNRHMERLALADASAGAGASMGTAVAGRASAGGGGEEASPGAVAPGTAVLPWLRMLRLPEDAAEAYAATLAAHGFEDVGALLFVTEAELAGATLGLKMGHARKAAHFLAQLQQGVDAAPAVAVARRHGAPALAALLSDRPFDLAVQQLATEATLELILQAPHDSFDSFAAYRAVRTRAYENGGAKARCRAFIAAGGVRAAVQLLETGVEDGATVFRAVQVLNLFIYQLYSDNEEGAELLRQASCIGPLVLVLKRWYDDTLLLTYCCNSLVGLAYGDNLLRTEIKRLGGIPPIVRALATKLDDDDAVRWALTMLRNVAIYDANKVAIAEAGGVERVLAVLGKPRFQHNIPVCEGAPSAPPPPRPAPCCSLPRWFSLADTAPPAPLACRRHPQARSVCCGTSARATTRTASTSSARTACGW